MTTNGSPTFFDSGLDAALQASLDVANFTAEDSGPGPSTVAAAGVSAVAGIASAVFAGENLGVNIANAVNSDSAGQLQIDIVNYSSVPVVVYDYNPSNADITDAPSPLAAGDNDLFVLTRDEPFDSSSSLGINLLVGSGPTGSIQVELTYGYSESGNPGRWTLSAVVDGASHTFVTNVQMFGLTFAGNTGFPSFSIYTSVIETSSGVMSAAVYDLAPS